ncbi:MAG TPA: glutaredoxin family protein [Burkholderiales bacterium]|nr:glutaredoxin family protein [Burkholderiales bacterium]
MRRGALLLGILLALPLAPACAQPLYRWIDQSGQVHVSDQPPPPSARDVEKKAYGGSVVPTREAPYELAKAMKDAPVMLYTSPTCKDACAQARAALNKRGVPFKEISVWNPQTNAELKRVSQSNEVPVLVVGARVQTGFSQSAFDGALDVAGYPKAGILPSRSQAAPAAPQGYVPPSQRAPQPQQAEEPPKPLGPYAPR